MCPQQSHLAVAEPVLKSRILLEEGRKMHACTGIKNSAEREIAWMMKCEVC